MFYILRTCSFRSFLHHNHPGLFLNHISWTLKINDFKSCRPKRFSNRSCEQRSLQAHTHTPSNNTSSNYIPVLVDAKLITGHHVTFKFWHQPGASLGSHWSQTNTDFLFDISFTWVWLQTDVTPTSTARKRQIVWHRLLVNWCQIGVKPNRPFGTRFLLVPGPT